MHEVEKLYRKARKSTIHGGMRMVPPLILFVLLLYLFAPPALAQGCALCRSTVETQASSVAETLNLGIVVLLLPPLGFMLSILILAFRRDKEQQPAQSAI